MLYKITKHGRVGQITPTPSGELGNTLEVYMSYKKQGAQFMPNPNWAWVRIYKLKTGRFPWGMIEKVKSVFDKWKLKNLGDNYIVDYKTPKIPEFKDLNPKLRYYQADSIIQLLINGGGILCLPTGAGKTFTAIEYLKILKKKTLVIVHTLDLKEQWKTQVPDFVEVVTYQSLNDKSILKDYEVLVFDECHHVTAKTIFDIAIKGGNSILVGLSATPWREDGEDMRIQAALGEIVYRIDRRTLISKGYLSDAEVYYVTLNKHCTDKFMEYHEIYEKYITYNEERNMKIVDIVKLNRNKKILILVSIIEHGEEIKRLLRAEGIDDARFIHGKSKDRSLAKDDNLIIASTIWDEGVDLPSFDTLILGAGGASGIKLTQRIGRVLRPQIGKKAKIYDFVDRSRYLIRHYRKRIKLLQDEFVVQER
jgi:superfamily II DNA or RNA helicase